MAHIHIQSINTHGVPIPNIIPAVIFS